MTTTSTRVAADLLERYLSLRVKLERELRRFALPPAEERFATYAELARDARGLFGQVSLLPSEVPGRGDLLEELINMVGDAYMKMFDIASNDPNLKWRRYPGADIGDYAAVGKDVLSWLEGRAIDHKQIKQWLYPKYCEWSFWTQHDRATVRPRRRRIGGVSNGW